MSASQLELFLAAGLLASVVAGTGSVVAGCPDPALLPGPAGEPPRVVCSGPGEPLRGPLPLLFGDRLDPGVAGAAALEHLPGIGPVRAAALVGARATAPFCQVPDLLRVHGIGPRTAERLAPYLRFGGDPRCARGPDGRTLDSAAGGKTG